MRRAYVKFRTQGRTRRVPLKATGGGIGGYFSRRRSRVYGRPMEKKTGYWAGVQALNEVRRLKRDEEIKEKSVSTVVTVPLADTWITQYLNDIDQGTTLSTRIGNKIVLKSVRSRLYISWNGADTTCGAIRFALVYDRNPRGVLATGAQIFNTNDINANINSSNPLYAGRFQILHDEIVECKGLGQQDTNIRSQFLDPMFVRRSMKTEYNATGGGIADCQKGALLWAACGFELTGDASLNHNTKIKYADM